jgi:hypothetical protein
VIKPANARVPFEPDTTVSINLTTEPVNLDSNAVTYRCDSSNNDWINVVSPAALAVISVVKRAAADELLMLYQQQH